MAYTRVNWENFPSTNTPRNATNLNVMDEGLFNQDARITTNTGNIATNTTNITNLQNVTKYITATAGSNGDFKINIANTLATGDVYNITFPAATTSTSNARLSIDNGTTYKNIFINGLQTIASSIQSKSLSLRYNGTQFVIDNIVLFSTTEQVIGEWIGKPLYRRVFIGTTNNETTTPVTNLIKSDQNKLINAYGYIGDTNAGTILGNYINNSWFSGLYINNDLIQLYVGSSLYNKPYEIALEYTKLSD